jgi:hypothetical protein
MTHSYYNFVCVRVRACKCVCVHACARARVHVLVSDFNVVMEYYVMCGYTPFLLILYLHVFSKFCDCSI